ncbi:MAG: polyprenyl synthetase family protein [Candidatus Thermoplasmatota archaeon]|nr:polyprenyl synthetase family protein [Candidatus Thermoplasmatota archaeon]
MSELEDQIEAGMMQVEETLRHAMEGSSVLGDMGSGLIESGGKRIRPELLMVSYIAGGGKDISETVEVAAAFELIHTASLIHDDITDDPTLRRRRPAPHRRYGLSRALIAGDFIFAKSFQLLAGVNEEVSTIIADAALATAEGEHVELMLSFDATVTQEQHEDIMMKKTAALFTAAAMAGATIGGMDEEHKAALEFFSINLGLAFQITDDVLDLEPSAALTGKPSGMDLREGRMNTVILAALEMLKGGERDKVVRVFMASSPSTQDVEATLVLIRGTGGGGVAINRAQKHVDTAMAALESFDEPVREHLGAMAKEVVRRRS